MHRRHRRTKRATPRASGRPFGGQRIGSTGGAAGAAATRSTEAASVMNGRRFRSRVGCGPSGRAPISNLAAPTRSDFRRPSSRTVDVATPGSRPSTTRRSWWLIAAAVFVAVQPWCPERPVDLGESFPAAAKSAERTESHSLTCDLPIAVVIFAAGGKKLVQIDWAFRTTRAATATNTGGDQPTDDRGR